jgi:hypothetical protein
MGKLTEYKVDFTLLIIYNEYLTTGLKSYKFLKYIDLTVLVFNWLILR